MVVEPKITYRAKDGTLFLKYGRVSEPPNLDELIDSIKIINYKLKDNKTVYVNGTPIDINNNLNCKTLDEELIKSNPHLNFYGKAIRHIEYENKIIMQEQVVNFELAKLAKYKNFNWPTEYKWHYPINNNVAPVLDLNGKHEDGGWFKRKINSNNYENEFSAPTLSLLQKWFRDYQNIECEPYRVSEFDNNLNYGCQVEKWNKIKPIDWFNDYANNYESALTKGLFAAFSLLDFLENHNNHQIKFKRFDDGKFYIYLPFDNEWIKF